MDAVGGLDALVNNAALIAGLQRRPFDEIADDGMGSSHRGQPEGRVAVRQGARAAPARSRRRGDREPRVGDGALRIPWARTLRRLEGGGPRLDAECLARELGPDRIRVNALAPGFIATEGSSGLTGAGGYDVSGTPLGRVGQPSDLLGALGFLISDDTAFVTGQTLLVNGGRLLS